MPGVRRTAGTDKAKGMPIFHPRIRALNDRCAGCGDDPCTRWVQKLALPASQGCDLTRTPPS